MNKHDYETEVYDAWYVALVAEDFDKALQIAARAYVKAIEEQSTESAILSRKFVRLAAREAGRKTGDREPAALAACSFCCEKIGLKQCVQGPSARICETCIAIAARLTKQ